MSTALIPFQPAPAILSDRTLEVVAVVDQCAAAVKACDGFKVTDAATAEQAAALAGRLKDAERALEKLRKEAVQPHVDFQRDANAWARSISDVLAANSRATIESVSVWRRAEEDRVRREMEAEEKRRRDAEAAAAKAKADAEAAAKANDPGAQLDAAFDLANAEAEASKPITPAVVPAQISGALRSGGRTLGFRKVWTFRIVDESKVPEVFKSIDEGKIGSAVRQGAREIPGVEVFEKEEATRR